MEEKLSQSAGKEVEIEIENVKRGTAISLMRSYPSSGQW